MHYNNNKDPLNHNRQSKRFSKQRDLLSNEAHGRYTVLDSEAKLEFNSDSSESEFSKGTKERSSLAIKKKVSFNLNVKTYDPLPHVDYTISSSESEGEYSDENKVVSTRYFSENDEYFEEEITKTSNDSIGEDLDPLNYRYQNWRDSYDEGYEMDLEDSDLGEYESGEDDEILSENEISEQKCPLSVGESVKMVDNEGLSEDKNENSMPLVASLDEELQKLGFNFKAKRDRSEYVFSVLNPVENLTQWKAIKAKVPISSNKKRKENTKLDFDYKSDTNQRWPLIQDTAVNTSLSKWLVSSK